VINPPFERELGCEKMHLPSARVRPGGRRTDSPTSTQHKGGEWRSGDAPVPESKKTEGKKPKSSPAFHEPLTFGGLRKTCLVAQCSADCVCQGACGLTGIWRGIVLPW
jgi:hypothetical protein